MPRAGNLLEVTDGCLSPSPSTEPVFWTTMVTEAVGGPPPPLGPQEHWAVAGMSALSQADPGGDSSERRVLCGDWLSTGSGWEQ